MIEHVRIMYCVGKSTLLRQTCLLAIMAQIGCRVPAESFRMTSVDRIFTRVGASDRILSGQSTFFVELAETAMILKYASEDSLCILDELGRGTATFDGTAIAHAVLDNLVTINRSRCLFATHYHSLVDDWSMDPRITLGHMDCIVDTTQNHSNLDHDAEVIFLYKLRNGTSPRSYGINVAKLARLPQQVIELAIKQSMEFEARMRMDEASQSENQQYKNIACYYERLISIVHSQMSLFELEYAAKELWHRLQASRLLSGK